VCESESGKWKMEVVVRLDNGEKNLEIKGFVGLREIDRPEKENQEIK
jgi:hypothetical protein